MSNKRPAALDHTHEPATNTYDGFLSKSDKQIVDALRGQKPAYDALIETTGEPTGFTNNQNITVSYDPTTRKVTLNGTFEAYFKGVKIQTLKDGWVSEAHADVAGNYYLYYCDGWYFNTTPWTFQCLMVAFIQYNAHDIGIREVHGFMPSTTHEELHRVIGSFKRSGGDFTGYVLNSTTASDRRPDVSDTVVQDEDLLSTVTALSTKTYTQRYLSGLAVRSFTLGASDIIALSGSQPYWNENVGGTWQQTLFSNNSYGAIFIVALPTTADAGSLPYRYMFVQPQKNSASLAEIQALTPNDLTHGDSSMLVSEFVFIGKIIIRYTGGNWTLIQVDKIEGTRTSQVTSASGNYLSIVSHDATLSGDGTAGNVLSVVNDGHTHDGRYYTESEITSLLSGKQDTLVSGTNIKTINGASVLGSGDLTVSGTDSTKVAKAGDTMTGALIMGSGAGLLGSNVLNELQRVWAYGADYLGYGIYYNAPSSPDEIRIDVSGNAQTGTPDFSIKPNLAQVNGFDVITQADRGGSAIGTGYYLKLSDGTIIQFARITFSSASSTAMGAGGGFKSDNQTFTFPLSFTSSDSYDVSVTPEGVNQISASVQARTASVLTYCTHTVSSDATSRSRTVHILAIGR